MILTSLAKARAKGEKKLAVLLDPDKQSEGSLERTISLSIEAGVDFFFIGGSLLLHDRLEACLVRLGALSAIPRILFPGNVLQVSREAEAILLLSLISGRNPDLLIGQHVIAAPYLKESGLEILPTGYLLIDGGSPTSVSYMSNTIPIPANKPDIARCTAMAGEMLGLRLMYLDAGSGARNPVPEAMIRAVRSEIGVPLIVGGGIRIPEQAMAAVSAGADLIVIGNAIEQSPQLIIEMAEAIGMRRQVR